MQILSGVKLQSSALILVAGLAAVANANIIQYSTTLNGSNESPPNASAGVGAATLTYDDVAHTYSIHVQFSGLSGNVTASHIHGATTNPFTGTAGVMTQTPTYPGFPTGGTSGTYDATFNLTLPASWSATFLSARGGSTAAAETFFINAINDGKAYLNIHTTVVPGGEIRGFWTPAVPAPGSLAAVALGGLVATRRRRAR
jgi:hypothetical protein